jgi:outer membrane receptor protein involved in Fe transport
MRKKFVLAASLFLALCCGITVQAQETLITGTVNNAGKEAIPSVSIMVKGAIFGTVTDAQGKFKLTVKKLPVTLLFSSISYEPLEMTVNNYESDVVVEMKQSPVQGEVLVVSGTRVSTRIIESPVSIERIGLNQIRNSPVPPYELLRSQKGVDVTTSGFLFNTVSTRGFNGSGSARVNQLVDGMDNQAPGLNFFVGNFVGLTDLDVDNIELLPGASSALYGPGGMNGTILINSKDPFKHPGFSFQARQGIMHVDKRQRSSATPLYDYSFRYAKAFNNRFAFKIGAQYISAQDWLADDSSNYQRSATVGKVIPGNRRTDPNYDGVNVYGDESSADIRPIIQGAIQQNPALQPILQPFLNTAQNVSRTGYNEKDVIDPQTKNIKLSGALHYKLNNKLEAILAGYWGTGSTVYTGNNRYVLKDVKIGQYKLELRNKNWFVRSYTTQENAGEAYSATVTLQIFNEAWKPSFDPANISGSWYPQYTGAFATGAAAVFQQAYAGAISGGQSQQQALVTAQAAVVGAAPQLHQSARAYADQGRPEPGSQQFTQIFDQVRKTPIPNGGLFLEKSQLWMTEGQYNFSNLIKFADVIAGANFKKYILNSEGTLFIDTLRAIGIQEVGAYAQVTKKIFHDKLTLSVSGRFDKNENFKGHFTPRATALINLAKDHNLRLSYQTAYRFPSTQQNFIRLDVGGYTLLGGLPWVLDYMDVEKNPVIDISTNAPLQYKEFKPESMRSFEVGYKGLINKKLLIDAYGYVGKYQDFLGRIGLYQPNTGNVYSIVVNSATKVNTSGFGLGLDYRLPSNYSVFFNVYSDVLTNVPSGFQSYFNTPKYRLNAGFGNSGFGKSKRFGFNALFRWQDSFMWDGELANGPIKSFTTIDAQVNYQFPKIKSMFKLGGTNILNKYYQTGYANPKIGGVYYASFAFNIF